MRLNTWMAACAALTLAGCGWVDSGGRQTGQAGEVVLDDGVSAPVMLMENTDAPLAVRLVGANSELAAAVNVQDTPVAQGFLPGCSQADGFDQAVVPATLAEACSSADACRLSLEPQGQVSEDDPELLNYTVSVPALRAPIGLRYRMEVVDQSGRVLSRNEPTFCLVAINESPEPGDDSYVIVDGDVLTVGFAGGVLANDQDDIDNRNQALSVVTESVVPPAGAVQFSIAEDGSFTYQPAPLNGFRGRQERMTYSVSDGFTDPREASVVFNIQPRNQPPVFVRQLPTFDAVEGAPLLIDLAGYFVDPEGQELTFSLDAVPALSMVTLDDTGELQIIPDEGEAGSYRLSLSVSDGALDTDFEVALDVEMAPPGFFNDPPEYIGSVGFVSQTVLRGRAIRPMTARFVDPDGDDLTYSVRGGRLPTGIRLDPETGRIFGTPTVRVWVRNLYIQAEDPYGATANSTLFSIRVR